VKTSESIKNLAAALLAAQKSGAFAPLERTATNPHFHSKYSGLESVVFFVVPLLNSVGVSVVQGCTEDGKAMATRLIHVASGEWAESYYPVRSTQDTPQAWMSATTYARRYGLLAAVCAACEDDDGERAEGRGRAPKSSPVSADPEADSLAASAPPPDDDESSAAVYDGGESVPFPPATCVHCGGREFWRDFKGKPLVTKNGSRYAKCKKCARCYGEDGGTWGGKK
jgi:hypothetical protein